MSSANQGDSRSQKSANQESSDQSDGPESIRFATIGHVNGEALGAPIYLTADEIYSLGGDPEGMTVAYRVADGRLLLE